MNHKTGLNVYGTFNDHATTGDIPTLDQINEANQQDNGKQLHKLVTIQEYGIFKNFW